MGSLSTILAPSTNFTGPPVSFKKPGFHRHRYPRVSLEEIREQVSLFHQVRGASKKLEVEQISNQFSRIGTRASEDNSFLTDANTLTYSPLAKRENAI